MSSPPPKPDFLTRLRRWLPRSRGDVEGGSGGVTITGGSVNVSGDIVGGDKIINIGSVVVPVRFLVALLVVALLVAVGVWWIVTPGQMPAGSANVAIVEFGAQNPDGSITSSAQGTYLSQWLYNRLGDSLSDLPAAARPTFWHIATGFDLPHLFQKRSIGGPIRTDADAEKVAQDFNARIVIYGNLAGDQDPTTFTPRFYISQSAGEADELSGSQQLGSPIPMSRNVNDEYLEQTLQPIGRALVWFSRGLNNDLNGRYDLAYQVLTEGEKALTDWNENQGKEVLYYFIGREALFMANCEKDAALQFKADADHTAVDAALSTAGENFMHAQTIAANNGRTYPRATFGLGQVALQRAQRAIIPPSAGAGQCRINLPPPDSPTTCPMPTPPNESAEAVSQARTYLTDAMNKLLDAEKALPKDQSQPRLQAKVLAAQATADTFNAQLDFIGRRSTEAGPSLEKAIGILQPLTASISRDDLRTLTNTYFALGNAQYFSAISLNARGDKPAAQAQATAAKNSFDACVNLIPADTIDALLRVNQRPNCACRSKDTGKLLEELK